MKLFRQLYRRFSPERTSAIALAVLVCVASSLAQKQVDLEQAFLDVKNDCVIMNISAHPDDEDGASLAYYRMKYGVKTYSILFTRGEGGQNETGPELYEELGVLRTAETRSAGKILGTEVHFLNFKDFGFSKTATETFSKWGGPREPLRRLVYAIRKYKPDIIFTNHNTMEGHGHHQVVAITAIAAFDAAADSSYFPEQLKLPGITLWQPRKLFFRNFGGTERTSDVSNPIGDSMSTRGLTYFDIAVNALRQHKTQGMDRADLRRFTRGLSLYRLMRSNSMYDRDTTSFFGGIDLWRDPSLSSLADVRKNLSRLHNGMKQDSLLAIVSDCFSRIEKLKGGSLSPLARRMLAHWQEELENLITQTFDIQAAWTLSDTRVVPGQKVMSTFRIEIPHGNIGSLRCEVRTPGGWGASQTAKQATSPAGNAESRSLELTVGKNAIPTLPRTVALYNPPESEENVELAAHFMLNGKQVMLTVRLEFDVAPLETIDMSPGVTGIFSSRSAEGKQFAFRVTNYTPQREAGTVRVQMPAGWKAESASYAISSEDSSAAGVIKVTPPGGVKPGEYKLHFVSDFAGEDVTVKIFDVKIDGNLDIGIIKSYDTTLESAADELGVKYKLLGENDLQGDLSPYKTIIIDIRAYLVREDLKKNNGRLLDYVRNGGNLVVMYQKDQEWKSEYAPYPMQVSRKRITVEEAPVTILRPDHPLFNVPEKITDEDWTGWIQERGVYFPDNAAPEYVHLLSSHDPDEQPLTTGYLVANYGRGSYIYTSYVWYRQLKEYNPGAFHCFINMIAYPNHRTTP